MSVFCKSLDKEFDSKEEMFAELLVNKDRLIQIKKAAIKDSDAILCHVRDNESQKAEGDNAAVGYGSTIYPVINTTNWLDSHDDLHVDGIWDVSVKDQQGKVYYIINHDLMIGSVISYPDDVEPMIQSLSWKQLGFDYEGTTQALIFKTTLNEYANADAYKAIVAKKPLQNSIRMRYIDMALCINDNSDDYKAEKANFDKYLKVCANKEDALERGYFWAITQAAIHKEGSAVIFGSNSATPIRYSDPSSNSQENKSDIDPPQVQSDVKVKSTNYFFTLN